MNKKAYINLASDRIRMLNTSENCKDLESVTGVVTLGSDSLKQESDFEIISLILKKFKEKVVYITTTGSEYDMKISKLDNVKIVPEKLNISFCVDIYIHLREFLIIPLKKENRCFLANTISTNNFTSTLKHNWDMQYETKYPFIFNFLATRENFTIKNKMDMVKQYFANTLDEVDVKRLLNSEDLGIDQFMLFLELGIKNSAFRQRHKEISYLDYLYTTQMLSDENEVKDSEPQIQEFVKILK